MRMTLLLAAAALSTNLATTGVAATEPTDLGRQTESAWAVLDHSLGDGNSEHRQQGLAALATLGAGSQAAIDKARPLLRDKDVFVRRAAAVALGQLCATSAIPDLKEALTDDSPDVAFAAAKVLTQMGDPDGRDLLIAVMAGERKDTPGMFTNAMRKAKDKLHHPEGLILMGAEDATGAMFGPASMAIPAVKNAIDLKGKGAPGRAAAVAYMAKYPDEYAIRLLEWALDDDNMFVRLEAARALGERGDAASMDKLRSKLKDDANFVRVMAAASMIRICERNGSAGGVTPGPVTPPQTSRKPGL